MKRSTRCDNIKLRAVCTQSNRAAPLCRATVRDLRAMTKLQLAYVLLLAVTACLAAVYSNDRMEKEEKLPRNQLWYRIAEEQAERTLVGNIEEDSGLRNMYDNRILAKLSYRFLSKPRISFLLDEKSGDLKTGDRIDRDVLCPYIDTCTVKLDVAVWPVNYFQIIKVSIEILDINDNSPTFSQKQVTHDILESALPGNSFVIPTAMDPDSSEYGVQKYSLISNTTRFDLNVNQKVDGSVDVRLVLKKHLDREKRTEYKVKVGQYIVSI